MNHGGAIVFGIFSLALVYAFSISKTEALEAMDDEEIVDRQIEEGTG